jgi:hypothetical protein
LHLLERVRAVGGVQEADEAVPFGLVGALVANDPGPVERRISLERLGQSVVVHLVAQIAAKDAVVVCKQNGDSE